MSSEVKLQGTAVTPANEKPLKPSEQIKRLMSSRKEDFIQSLPSHISFDKFQRTVMTAVLTDPALLQADRHTLMVSALKAASDGLLPDKREAAFVIFNTKVKDDSGADVWINAVQYMPMYLGILKKVRQSKELASVVAHVVYEKDEFSYTLGDDENINHTPYMGREDRGSVIAAYAIARLTDGSVIREVMSFQDIEKVRKASKSGSANAKDVEWKKAKEVGEAKGIWKEWYPEMARKTVFRRLAKWLPQSVEIIDQAFENDDSMEVLDHVKGDEGTYEDPKPVQQLTDESSQPDLAAEIEKANAKDEEKIPVKKSKLKKDADTKADASPPKEEEKEDEPVEEETIFNQIKYALEYAQSLDEVYDLWTVDFKDDVKAMSKEDRDTLESVYKIMSKKYQE